MDYISVDSFYFILVYKLWNTETKILFQFLNTLNATHKDQNTSFLIWRQFSSKDN